MFPTTRCCSASGNRERYRRRCTVSPGTSVELRISRDDVLNDLDDTSNYTFRRVFSLDSWKTVENNYKSRVF